MSRRCSHHETCELFPLLQRGGFLRVWQERYCEAGYEACARYKASSRGERPPITLLPSGEKLSFEPS